MRRDAGKRGARLPRLAGPAAVVLAALACCAPAAQAHALLEGTTPERGAVVEPRPRAGRDALQRARRDRVRRDPRVRRDGRAGPDRRAVPSDGKGDEVAIRLRSGLPRGGYTATYRVVSADSHPVSGGFVFSVGNEAAATGASVGDLLGDQGSGPGHYVINSAALSPPGDWRLELVARITEFDELRTTLTVPIE